MIKLALISIVTLFLVVTCISLFFPSHVRISRAINVKATPETIWDKVDNLQNWEQWNPFFSNLATKKIEFLDTSNGNWNAVKVGSTSVKWKEKKPEEHIAAMQNGERRPVYSGWKCIRHQVTDSITVQWYMDFHVGWTPWEKFGSMFYEKKYGAPMEQGLANLKALVGK